MINIEKFVGAVESEGVSLFCGVPDSLLKTFCAFVTDTRAFITGADHIAPAQSQPKYGIIYDLEMTQRIKVDEQMKYSAAYSMGRSVGGEGLKNFIIGSEPMMTLR